MMMGFRFTSLAVAILGAGLAAGCTNSSTSASGKQPVQAVMCDKCETTWVIGSTSTGTHGQVLAIQKHKVMECADCRSEATTILQSGKTTRPGEVVHKCQSCGGTMTACETH